jgi:hypothetical protein
MNLATWWAGETPGGRYVRCDLPARYLPGQVVTFNNTDLSRDNSGNIGLHRNEGTTVWQFPGRKTHAVVQACVVQEHGGRYVVEVDDNYLIPSPFIAGAQRDWQQQIDRTDGDAQCYDVHRKIAENADTIIVSTPELARIYRDVNPNIQVCQNCVDPGDWPDPVKPDDGVFRIGYAASDSHIHDAKIVETALGWASMQSRVEVYLFGATRFKWKFKHKKIRWLNDVADYRKAIGVLDVGVCPLWPDPWANCRSDLKALEYTMAGALSVMSPSVPYRPWDNAPCLHADGRLGFLEQIQWCVKNPHMVRELAAQAKDYVLEQRTIQTGIAAWREVL